jgi:hypothetical protein
MFGILPNRRWSEAVGVACGVAAVRRAVHVILLGLPRTRRGRGRIANEAQRNAGENDGGDESLADIGTHDRVSSFRGTDEIQCLAAYTLELGPLTLVDNSLVLEHSIQGIQMPVT